MDKEKIVPFDVWRMVFGDAPPEYFIEIFFRGLALYLFMLFIMRLLGKRMAGELTVTEMVLIITLGASVTVAIQDPEGGVLLGFVVLTCALLFERVISVLTLKSKRFEELSQGRANVLVKDGVLQLKNMKDNKITQQQLFANLRGEKIYNLGKVERVYIEAAGEFSIYKIMKDAPPGLPVLPPDDKEVLTIKKKAEGLKACANCGFTVKNETKEMCDNCNSLSWTEAIS